MDGTAESHSVPSEQSGQSDTTRRKHSDDGLLERPSDENDEVQTAHVADAIGEEDVHCNNNLSRNAQDVHIDQSAALNDNSVRTHELDATVNTAAPIPSSNNNASKERQNSDISTSQTNTEEEDDAIANNTVRLRDLMEASADCWDDNLSDDDNTIPVTAAPKLPLHHSTIQEISRKKDPPGTILSNSIPSSHGSEEDGSINNNNIAATTTTTHQYEMSLPEQLLRNRLAKKQRLQKKHELFLRYHQQQHPQKNQLQQHQHQEGSSSAEIHSNDNIIKPQHNKQYSQDNFQFLSGSASGSTLRSNSPLFTQSIEDEDNVSIVASSNGSTYHSSPLPNNQTIHTQQTLKCPLESIPSRPVVPLPDESDRKRVLGCLASILASAYSYETVPELMMKKTTVVGASHVLSSESMPGEKKDDVNNDVWHTEEPMHQQYLSHRQGRSSRSSSFHHAHSMGEIPRNNPTSSKPNFFSSFNNKFDINMNSSQNPPSQLTAELAEIRHRIRRHAVLSELLVSSAEMLLLDPMHAKAYLPMLEGLLTKKEEEKKVTRPVGRKESWKGRGFGGGGMHPHVHMDGTMSVHGGPSSYNVSSPSSKSRISSSLHGTSPTGSNSKSLKSSMSLPVRQESYPLPERPMKNAPSFVATNNIESLEKTVESLDITHHGKDSTPLITTEHRPPTPTSKGYSPLDTIIVDKNNITPFLETLTPGAGFRCIALLLLNHLLRDGRGYDARVRQAFKRLAVVILSHELKVGGILRVDLEDDDNFDEMLWGSESREKSTTAEEEFDDVDELALLATRKFEAMEHAIATKLIAMSKMSDSNSSKKSHKNDTSHTNGAPKRISNGTSSSSVSHGRIALAPKETPLSSQHGLSREQLMRGLKIGTAGAVGATLFALTGGLAAPGIAAGLAAVAGGSAVAVGVTTVLSSAAAVSTIFGVGGAGLAGYKMHRRTKGLTEFDFQKEGMSKSNEAELFSTVCISGWLRDSRDFQRPWGVSPSHPRIVDKLELLERFYFVHNPSNLDRCQKILKHWKGRYFQLWKALHQKYGTDPSNLFPLKEGPRLSADLTHEESEAITFLLKELGYLNETDLQQSAQNSEPPILSQIRSSPPAKVQSAQQEIKDSLTAQKGMLESFRVNGPGISTISSNLSLFEEDSQVKNSESDDKSTQVETKSSASASSKNPKQQSDQKPDKAPPKHLLTVWDYNAQFGGELYTVKWESDLLMELCDSVTDQMIEWGISGTKTILHTTVFATLMTAVTIPYSLAMASNVIDDTWAMAMERADRAGIELAKSLIDSNAGHRPVVLVGFSMGARVIYSCLKELTRQQEIWEDEQQKKGLPSTGKRQSSRRKSSDENLQYIREPASIIEDAIMMGMPNHVSLKSWESSRRVVAGRLINCYSRKDMILSLMFQLKRMQGILRPVCGTSPVVVNGVENFDVTDLVSAHTDYCLVTGEILKRVRHLQPQRPSHEATEEAAMVTKIDVANYGFTPLSDETTAPKK